MHVETLCLPSGSFCKAAGFGAASGSCSGRQPNFDTTRASIEYFWHRAIFERALRSFGLTAMVLCLVCFTEVSGASGMPQRIRVKEARTISQHMTPLVARTGRHQQRYDKEFRLVAGCIPYRYRIASEASNGDSDEALEVLMITSQGGQGLLFPKGGWETDESVQEAACREALEEAGVRGLIKKNLGMWDFRSKRHQGDCGLEGSCRACMFALFVTEQLDSWPEQNARQRSWVTITEAVKLCRYDWMREALQSCVSYLFNKHTISHSLSESDDNPVSNDCSFKLSDQKQL